MMNNINLTISLNQCHATSLYGLKSDKKDYFKALLYKNSNFNHKKNFLNKLKYFNIISNIIIIKI